MKIYGETMFDIVYLLFAIVVGTHLLLKSNNKNSIFIDINLGD